MTTSQNNELYRELSIPFESVDKANEKVKAFCEELYDLRVKYRIRDLLYVIRIGCVRDDGDEADATIVNHYGASENMEGIAAYAYGQLSARRAEAVQDQMSQATRAVKGQASRK